MKKFVFIAVTLLQSITVFGQQNSGVKGVVTDAKTQKPLQNVVVMLESTKQTVLSKDDGTFELTNVPTGSHFVNISTVGYTTQYIEVEILQNKTIDLGTITLEEDITSEQELSLITLTENDLSDDNSGSESTSGLLQASRDAFNQAAAYNFGQARFRVRGIDNEYSNVMINGILMNRLSDGRPQYSNWGGLNDATRNQEFSNGTSPSDYTFGGTAGTQYINTRASGYRNGNRVSFLSTNTNYNFRVMATTAVTNMPNGWSYVISAGRRWANNGHFEGTNYAANSFFASVEKTINDKHSIGITAMYAQNRRGKNSPNTQEVIDLKGFKYNSYWGYQEGEKRNSRFKDVKEPLLILSHYWKPSDKIRINTNFGYQTGKIGNSRFDFQFADNPDPVYYKKLPSYYTTYYNNNVYAPNQAAADDLKATFLAYGQVDWKDIYRINNENLNNGSRIVLYEDRTDDTTKTGNINILAEISDNIIMNSGVNYIHSKSENFRNLLDLLGGNYYNNINTFGIGDQRQNDLINPNRTIYKNDKFGYSYDIVSTKLDAFTQFKFNYKKIDFYLTQSFSKNTYQREGFYKNGYYPTNSYGKSEKINFETFGFKGGLTYKFKGNVMLNANALYMTKAPNSKDVFPYQRQNNVAIENLTNETQSSADISFIVRLPKIKTRFTGYYNENKNTTDVSFYYADEIAAGGSGVFVTETVTGQNTRSIGLEFGTEMQFTSTIKGILVAALGDYEYTNNPTIIAKSDLNVVANNDTTAKLKGYKVSGTPQTALSVGLEYRDPKFWWIGANANYIANNYIDVAPLLRTNDFITKSNPAVIAYNEALAQKYLTQEKFDSFYLVNVVGGKSWRIKGKTLGLFANINNVLDTKYKTGGFEQSRNATFSKMHQDNQGAYRSFGNKYFYGYGRTFMVNLYLNF